MVKTFKWVDSGNLPGEEHVHMMWVDENGELYSEKADGDPQAYGLLVKQNYSAINMALREIDLYNNGGYGYFTWENSANAVVALLTSRAIRCQSGIAYFEGSNGLFLGGTLAAGTPSDEDAFFYKSGDEILMSIDYLGNMTVKAIDNSTIRLTTFTWNSWLES